MDLDEIAEEAEKLAIRASQEGNDLAMRLAVLLRELIDALTRDLPHG